MKRDKFFNIAEKMYVEQFITEEETARRIGVCDRTIRRWKSLGDWGIKREGFFESKYDIKRCNVCTCQKDD